MATMNLARWAFCICPIDGKGVKRVAALCAGHGLARARREEARQEDLRN